ncbi:MAG: hypothetical protein HW392_817, partial [Steroidobacteraceae bacterium]|nr:hypothetical protein [Steroidobacteraceae bacterium]
ISHNPVKLQLYIIDMSSNDLEERDLVLIWS